MIARALPAALLLASAGAWAQTVPPRPASARPAPATWTLQIGFAPVYSPVWQGSREMALSVFPDLRVNYKDSVFFSVPDGLGWNAVNRDGWRVGPLVKPRFGRDEGTGGSPFLITGGDDALRGLGNVGTSGEAGGFVQKSFGPGRRWRARTELRQGFGGHSGVIGDAVIGYGDRQGRFLYNIAARATWADSAFTNTFFGVDAAQSVRSGLPVSQLASGIVSYGLGSTIVRPLNARSSLTLLTSYERLGDTVADSSLVRDRGRRDQFTVGLAYGYRFTCN